jgi:hypothetical protein
MAARDGPGGHRDQAGAQNGQRDPSTNGGGPDAVTQVFERELQAATRTYTADPLETGGRKFLARWGHCACVVPAALLAPDSEDVTPASRRRKGAEKGAEKSSGGLPAPAGDDDNSGSSSGDTVVVFGGQGTESTLSEVSLLSRERKSGWGWRRLKYEMNESVMSKPKRCEFGAYWFVVVGVFECR